MTVPPPVPAARYGVPGGSTSRHAPSCCISVQAVTAPAAGRDRPGSRRVTPATFGSGTWDVHATAGPGAGVPLTVLPRAVAHPPSASAASALRLVMLATLAVPFDDETAALAMQAALEVHATLIVIDVVELPSSPIWPPHSFRYGGGDNELDEDREQIRRLVDHAAGLGLTVEYLRVRTRRPVAALLEVSVTRGIDLLVLGPDPRRFKPRVLRRVVRKLRREAPCLLWIVGEGP